MVTATAVLCGATEVSAGCAVTVSVNEPLYVLLPPPQAACEKIAAPRSATCATRIKTHETLRRLPANHNAAAEKANSHVRRRSVCSVSPLREALVLPFAPPNVAVVALPAVVPIEFVETTSVTAAEPLLGRGTVEGLSATSTPEGAPVTESATLPV